MGQQFGSKPSGGRSLGSRRVDDRDRILFIAAAGLAFSLFVIMLVVLNYKQDANAKSDGKLTSSQLNPSQPVIGTVTLLAPDRAVRAGSKLSEVTFKEVYWPRNKVPGGAIKDSMEVRSLYAKVNLSPGVPLQREMLSGTPLMGALPVTPGNRAVAIEVDQTSSLEGHALPGTRVDVTLTYMANKELTTQVIVQNARVLSFGGDTKNVNEMGRMDRGVSRNSTITLDVAPPDALKIQTARQMGRLSLFMRSSDDDDSLEITELNQNQLGQNPREEKSAPTQPICKNGMARFEGKEYVIGCDGALNRVITAEEP